MSAKWCDLGPVETWDDVGDHEPPMVDHGALETEYSDGLAVWSPYGGALFSDTTMLLEDRVDPIERDDQGGTGR